MSGKSDLRGSFGSLIDTLSLRFDPLAPQKVAEQWLGLMGQSASIARERTKWKNLPDEHQDYAGIIKALDQASRDLVIASGGAAPAMTAALDACEGALSKLSAALG
jgi:hypothetical protein